MVLELGCHHGRSTIALASTARRVHTVDWFNYTGTTDQDGEAVLSDFRSNLKRYDLSNRIVLHIGDLEEVLPFLDRRFDGLFLDAGHDYLDVMMQIGLGVLKLRGEHPWVAIHDYDRDVAPEVKPAFDSFVKYWHGAPLRVVETLAILTS